MESFSMYVRFRLDREAFSERYLSVGMPINNFTRLDILLHG
jgi:hypothetical protein